MSSKNNVNCRDCAHFYVTWRMNYPYGCRSMGFNSRNLPCIDVLAQEGKVCMAYESKSAKVNSEILPGYTKVEEKNDEILNITV